MALLVLIGKFANSWRGQYPLYIASSPIAFVTSFTTR